MSNRKTLTTWWLWLPLAVGVIVGAPIAVFQGDRRVYVSAAPALLIIGFGVVLTLTLLATSAIRGRFHRQRQVVTTAAETRADEARRRFVGRLDHELKNPLTALLAALSTDRTDVAHAQAERLRRLLTDLRRVTDVETVPLEYAPVDINWLLHEAADSAQAAAPEGRTVTIDLPSAPWPLPNIKGDVDLLLVAVHNVLANAVKYTAPSDRIEIRAREAPGPQAGIVIDVADTGPGIPAHEQGYVWEELARGRHATGTTSGSGVGLALVRAIVERHRGWAELRSREGLGTEVRLFLPAAPA